MGSEIESETTFIMQEHINDIVVAYMKQLLHFKPTNPQEIYAFSSGYFTDKLDRSKQVHTQPDKSTEIGDSRGRYCERGRKPNDNETKVTRKEKLQQKHVCSKSISSPAEGFQECCLTCEKMKAVELLKIVKLTWNFLAEKSPVSTSSDQNMFEEELHAIPIFLQFDGGDSAEGSDKNTPRRISSVAEQKSYVTSDDEATSGCTKVKIKHSTSRNKKYLPKKASSRTTELKSNGPKNKTNTGFTYVKNKPDDCIDDKSQTCGTQDETGVFHLKNDADNNLERDDRNNLASENDHPNAKNRKLSQRKRTLNLTEAFGNNSKDYENFALEKMLRELEKSVASNPGKKPTNYESYIRRLYSYFVLTANMVHESVCKEECNVNFSK